MSRRTETNPTRCQRSVSTYTRKDGRCPEPATTVIVSSSFGPRLACATCADRPWDKSWIGDTLADTVIPPPLLPAYAAACEELVRRAEKGLREAVRERIEAEGKLAAAKVLLVVRRE